VPVQAPPSLESQASELCEYGRRLLAEGLAYGTAGNLSCRAGERICITPSSVAWDQLTPADIWVLGLDGNAERAGLGAPSSELPLHLRVYSATSAQAIVHTHSPEVVALSAVLDQLPAIHYSIVDLGGPVPVIPYSRFGSHCLADRASAALTDRSAIILENHGAVTYGRSLARAYQRALLLEWLAGVYRRATQLGTPRILSANELEQVIAEARRRRYALHGSTE
jgi:L-fuculose-phosphate aldolase